MCITLTLKRKLFIDHVHSIMMIILSDEYDARIKIYRNSIPKFYPRSFTDERLRAAYNKTH